MRIVFTHVCVLPQSGLEATDCFVEALLCLNPGCREVSQRASGRRRSELAKRIGGSPHA